MFIAHGEKLKGVVYRARLPLYVGSESLRQHYTSEVYHGSEYAFTGDER